MICAILVPYPSREGTLFFVSYFVLSVPRDVNMNKSNLRLCGKNIILRLNKHTEKNSSKRNICISSAKAAGMAHNCYISEFQQKI